MKRPPTSLQARALGWLAQREHSRSELRLKLLRLARRRRADDQARAAGRAVGAVGAGGAGGASDETADTNDAADNNDSALAAQVDQLLDSLQAKGLLSEERFVESRIRVRAHELGTRRIELELARHGLELPALQARQLRDSELQRAAMLWQRRFGAAPADARERARQMRFLAARGFSGDVIRRVLGGAAPPHDEPHDG